MKLDFNKLDRAFNPKCVAVIGDSSENGFMWIRSQKALKGNLYSVLVNPKSIEAAKNLGIPNYTSILDIPEPVDLAIVCVPRVAALKVLDDCIRKDIAAAHFFTAGFSETNTEEGIRLELLLKEKADSANFHLIGPNCMGLFNPKAGIKQDEEQYYGISGPVGFISQSGTHALEFSLTLHLQGVDINKSVSFGNGTVLDSADYLEYFGRDPEIKVIGMYLEGVRNGKHFIKVLKEVSAQKPVVIWKGGRTEEGGRAIASHTGSLAVPLAIWDAAVRQCRAVKVASLEELVDTIKALVYLPPVQGNRVAVTGGSGGQSVAIADVFAEAGLRLPRLTKQSYEELATFYSLIGGGYGNPIDTGNQNRIQMARIMDILGRDANIDSVVVLNMMHFFFQLPGAIEAGIEMMVNARNRYGKPVAAIMIYTTPNEMQRAREATKKLQEQGIAAFPRIERGALSLRNALEYYRLKKRITD